MYSGKRAGGERAAVEVSMSHWLRRGLRDCPQQTFAEGGSRIQGVERSPILERGAVYLRFERCSARGRVDFPFSIGVIHDLATRLNGLIPVSLAAAVKVYSRQQATAAANDVARVILVPVPTPWLIGIGNRPWSYNGETGWTSVLDS